MLPPYISQKGSDAVLTLRVMPRASREGPIGLHGSSLKWGVHAAPVDGKANEAVIASVAAHCGVPKRDVTILSGETSREKRVLVSGKSAEELAAVFSFA